MSRTRTGLAALLSAVLIMSGVSLIAPAAYADEGAAIDSTGVVETPAPGDEAADEHSDGDNQDDGVDQNPADTSEASQPEGDDADSSGDDGVLRGLADPVMFSAFGVAEPEVIVSKTSGLNPLGDTITVTGTGFDTTTPADFTRYRTLGLQAGVYVQLGWIKDSWAPSAGGSTMGATPDRAGPLNQWVSNMAPAPIFWTDEATGSFTVTFEEVTRAKLTAGMPEDARPAVFTMVAGGAEANSAYEFAFDLTFSTDDDENGDDNNGDDDENNQPEATVKTPKAAGVLNWGVSSDFAAYTTGNIAKGRVESTGVGRSGGVFSFPQASSSWNADTQTGTVNYRGIVTYIGHEGLMVERFANPVITVRNASQATLSVNGYNFGLNLTAASRSVGSNGEVTWSNVPVIGAVSGGSGSSGGAFAMDTISSFTVGAVSKVNYASTVTTSPAATPRTPAPTPPATTGLTVVTNPGELVQGGEIEITAGGFEPNETGILVVMYSEPTVLDQNAKADENGVVRWLGKLPAGLTGTHTLTLQGSQNVGMVVEIAESLEIEELAATTSITPEAAGVVPISSQDGVPVWAWWVGAIALLVLAGASAGLVVAQRRRADAPTTL